MSEHHLRQKLTDEVVRAIMLAPASTPARELAAHYSCSITVIQHYRRRRSKRAIRLARELGLIPDRAPANGWMRNDVDVGVPA